MNRTVNYSLVVEVECWALHVLSMCSALALIGVHSSLNLAFCRQVFGGFNCEFFFFLETVPYYVI